MQQQEGIVFYLDCKDSQAPDDHVSEQYQELMKTNADYIITGESVGFIRSEFVKVFQDHFVGVV